jgi:leucyl-tRNA---protein transferase
LKSLPLYLGHEHACSYLPGRTARSIFVDPDRGLDPATYGVLAERGFRRSGSMVYRPYCQQCTACIPVRVAVARFVPNRTQSRIWRRNADLVVQSRSCEFEEIHYQLFREYLSSRHHDGGMADSDRGDYLDFLASDWAGTRFVEFREGLELIAVAVVDQMQDGLSAVYTFYDPRQQSRSLGVFAVLWQIAEAQRMGLSWLYLGFWIEACRKMSYKDQYRPLQALIGETWREFEKGKNILSRYGSIARL